MAETETQEQTFVTPSEIADATGADPKAVRAYLRSNFSRSKDMKGKSWQIPAEVAEKVIAHFTDSEEDETEEVEDDS